MGEEENRKVVRMCYESLNRGDLATLYEAVSDDVVWTNHGLAGCPYSGVYYGKGGVEEFFADLGSIELERLEVKKLLAQEDTVMVLLDDRYTVKSTGKSSEGPLVHVLTLRDGKITTLDEFEHCANSAWL